MNNISLRLSLLNHEYQKISNIIKNFDKHLIFLNENYLIDYGELLNYQNNLYNIVKKINSNYNDCLKKYNSEINKNISSIYEGSSYLR